MSAAAATLDRLPLSPRERLELLCDAGSLVTLRSRVQARPPARRTAAGDGVVAGTGTVEGRPVACYAQDGGFAGGSLGEAHADTIVRVHRIAGRAGIPVVGFVQSAGARLDEGGRALDGYGRIFSEQVALSGRVPQIAIVTGTSAGGGAYSPALTDFVIMVEDALMFLTGPGVVREALGEDVSAEALGGPRVHEQNGLCQLVARDDADAAQAARALLGYLPQSAADGARLRPVERVVVERDPGELVPASARAAYDVREVIAAIADGGALLECSARWARNIVTGFCRIDGRPVGVVANQPRHLGGVIDSAAAEKGALFVRRCDRFGVPILALVDTPGFMPGARQESAGIIRRGAALVHAFASARVPRLTVILRKAYGGAYITMNSRDLGADLVLAWPGAEIGVMAATQAAAILFRREIAGADDPNEARERLAAEYAAEHFGAEVAARDGFVDEVIEPRETRARLAAALVTLTGGVRSGA